MNLWKRILIGFLAVLVAFTGVFVIWGETPAQPMEEAKAALQSDAEVTVASGSWLVFSPANGRAATGFIFYPGGRVDYRAYAPMAHELAAHSILVVIPRMPLNLAVLGVNKAEDVVKTFPQVHSWYIGGHSLGGSMAADYLYKHQDTFAGLILLASYPASIDDLSRFSGKVLSISATNDGLATPEKIQASRVLLPASPVFYEVQGGKHAYFGWYGNQKGDGEASITREDQQQQVIAQILQFMK
jgi:hypothetical protein